VSGTDSIKLATQQYPGDGSTVTWDFNFAGGYISQTHVKVRVTSSDGTDSYPEFSWTGPSTIQVTPAVPTGAVLTIYRDTPKDKPIADFNDGAVVSEVNLDVNARQAVFVAAEARDIADAGNIQAIVVPERSGVSTTLPPAAGRAGKFIAFDGGGNPYASSGTGADAGLRTDLSSIVGATLIEWQPSIAGAVKRAVSALLDGWVSVKTFGAKCDGVTPDDAAVAACIAHCKTFTPFRPMLVDGQCLITHPAILDCPVATDVGEFRIIGNGLRAGFLVKSAITIFDSSLTSATDPLSHQIRFENIRFESSDATLDAYCLTQKFLRIKFDDCVFYKIKVLNSTFYVQDWHFHHCNFRYWKGCTFTSVGATYNSVWLDCTWEFGEDGIATGGFYGSKIAYSIFEGSRRFFKQGSGAGCTIVGNYTEGNSDRDYTFTNVAGGGQVKGLVFQGNAQFVYNATNTANPAWANVIIGDTIGAQFGGNYCTYNMYDMAGQNSFIPDFSNDRADGQLYLGAGTGIDDPARPNGTLRVFGKDRHRFYAARGRQYVAIGFAGNGTSDAFPCIQANPEGTATVILGWGPASPGSGYYGALAFKVGDTFLNSQPSAYESTGWTCTVAGSPGTWESFGVVGHIPSAVLANSTATATNSVAAPTMAEFNALVAAHNSLLATVNQLMTNHRAARIQLP
jgi:hypothetical protein